jgi:hypothetical protein
MARLRNEWFERRSIAISSSKRRFEATTVHCKRGTDALSFRIQTTLEAGW